MADVRKFKTNPVRELGLDASEAQNQALQIALAKPAQYFKLRNDLLKAVVKDHVQEIYNTVWNALTEGTTRNGSPILNLGTDELKDFIIGSGSGAAQFQPKFPESQVNAIALSIASGYKQLMDTQLVERILPKNLHELAIQKTAAKTATKIAAGDSDL
eukprot:55137-Eustigmatos_ZCMA.PRE.1